MGCIYISIRNFKTSYGRVPAAEGAAPVSLYHNALFAEPGVDHEDRSSAAAGPAHDRPRSPYTPASARRASSPSPVVPALNLSAGPGYDHARALFASASARRPSTPNPYPETLYSARQPAVSLAARPTSGPSGVMEGVRRLEGSRPAAPAHRAYSELPERYSERTGAAGRPDALTGSAGSAGGGRRVSGVGGGHAPSGSGQVSGPASGSRTAGPDSGLPGLPVMPVSGSDDAGRSGSSLWAPGMGDRPREALGPPRPPSPVQRVQAQVALSQQKRLQRLQVLSYGLRGFLLGPGTGACQYTQACACNVCSQSSLRRCMHPSGELTLINDVSGAISRAPTTSVRRMNRPHTHSCACAKSSECWRVHAEGRTCRSSSAVLLQESIAAAALCMPPALPPAPPQPAPPQSAVAARSARSPMLPAAAAAEPPAELVRTC